MKQLLYILRERLKLFGPKSQQLSNERQIIDDKMKQMGFENLDDDEIYHLKKKLSMKKFFKTVGTIIIILGVILSISIILLLPGLTLVLFGSMIMYMGRKL
ncbi:hypothetical protein HOD20_09470 [archaeon]|jgi:hypothetical protein|nr:hypothetical protein [archaeon]MBT4352739.1 hypothetical protein [archaeon]MBT4646970.1 hypothetical protein [archaeon]MBT6822565.1 hypothetical protein [archaeon]MBT7392750.1 hypothetical protein [archaeon]